MIVLDTHAWIWWVSESPRLLVRALSAIEGAEGVVISVISAWEVALKASLGKLSFNRPVTDWLALASHHPGLSMAPLTFDVATAAVSLPGEIHRDPCDRFIVALARHHDVELVTKDQKLLDYPHVRTVW